MSEHPVVHVFGEPIEIVVSSKSTNNTCCVGVQTSPPGGGPPPHTHLREEEIFTVLEGDYEFYNDGEWIPFHKGETRCSNRGSYHAFRNVGSAPGRVMFTTNGGGLDEYFAEISSLVLPQDLDRLNELSKYYGYKFLPPEPPPK